LRSDLSASEPLLPGTRKNRAGEARAHRCADPARRGHWYGPGLGRAHHSFPSPLWFTVEGHLPVLRGRDGRHVRPCGKLSPPSRKREIQIPVIPVAAVASRGPCSPPLSLNWPGGSPRAPPGLHRSFPHMTGIPSAWPADLGKTDGYPAVHVFSPFCRRGPSPSSVPGRCPALVFSSALNAGLHPTAQGRTALLFP